MEIRNPSYEAVENAVGFLSANGYRVSDTLDSHGISHVYKNGVHFGFLTQQRIKVDLDDIEESEYVSCLGY